jgi:hypothetical protein
LVRPQRDDVKLEDASSRGLSSVDFGRAVDQARKSPKGLALPPPTEFIQAPELVLELDAALVEVHREKSSIAWRCRLVLFRLGASWERFAERTSELMASMSASSRRWLRLLRRRARGMAALVRDGMQRDTRPTLELSRGCDFDDGDVADTARVPTPVPSKDPPAKRAPSVRLDPKPRKTSQRDITTQVIDLRKRRSSSLPRPDKVISVSDLFLPAGTPKPGT